MAADGVTFGSGAVLLGNREVALEFAASGIAVFPCYAGTDQVKRPLRGVYWRRQSTTDANQIVRWWDAIPDAVPAIDLAKASRIVIDCDPPLEPGGVDGVAWFRSFAATHGLDIDGVPGSVSWRGGRHLFFIGPPDLGNGRGSLPSKLETGVDVRGAGGYVIAPGAIMGDGRSYQPVGNVADANPLPGWLEAILRGVPQSEPSGAPEVAPPLPRADNQSRISAYTETAINAELATLRGAATGERNNTLNTVSFKLGQMAGAGWISEHDATAWLENGAQDIGLVKDDGIRSVRATIRSGMAAGRKEPRQEPQDRTSTLDGASIVRALLRQPDGTLFDEDTGEIVAELGSSIVDEMPSHLLQPRGLVGEIAAWVAASSRRPQPGLALGAALAVVGTAIGRHIAGPTLSATHLYIVGLAPTGAGKDHALQQCGRLLRAAGMANHIGPSEFISMPAVINFLLRSPLSLCAQDEFGAFLRRINSKKASGFEGAISKILRTAWGSSFAMMVTPEWAGRAAEPIMAPALSIFGASTPEEFYGAMEGADTDNGVLNRFLLLATTVRPPERDPLMSPFDVPQSITDGLAGLYSGGGILSAALRNASTLDTRPLVLTWGSDQARDHYEALGTDIERRSDNDVSARPFLARTVEMALRIATIVAAGRNSETVDADDMLFGRYLAMWSTETMIRGAREHIADTETQAEANRIVRTIKRHGGEIQHQKLLKTLQHRLRARDLKDLLAGMVEAGTILEVRLAAKDKGRPSISYSLPA